MSQSKPVRSSSDTQRWIEPNDLLQYGVRLYVSAVVRHAAEHRWPAAAKRVAEASMRARPLRTRKGIARIDRFFPDGPPGGDSATALLQRITTLHVEETMMYTRLAQRPDWRPTLDLHGLEHLEAALSSGRGAVLWSVHQIATSLLLRLALHDAGHRVHHLSHWSHGPSSTRVGQALLASASKRVEERVAERVVITPDGPLGALRELGRVVRRGGVASFRGIGMSAAASTLPLFGGEMLLAPGAPRTAKLSKAALLSVSGRRDAAGRWSVHIVPLRDADSTETLERTTERFRDVVAEAILEAPDLWPVQDRHFLVD